MKLQLGAGMKPVEGRVNVDMVEMPGIDVVWDLDEFPWPWEDGEVEEIHAAHVFEHVTDPVGFMCEAWRVLQPEGWLHIEVPYWKSRNAFTDPTHRRYCTEETFLYWVPGTWLWDIGGTAYHRGFAAFTHDFRIQQNDLVVDMHKTEAPEGTTLES